VPASIHDYRYRILQAQLVALRKSAGLTQSGLGDLLGVGQSYVSKIERGEAYVDVLLYVDWAKACGAEPVESFKVYALSSALK
jgi:transcriptional regulator with XRE-family HTH domain